MVKLSLVIITFNEEKNIARCIESALAVADEIVVVDSYSSDNTQAICAKYPVKFIQHPFEGYQSQKNYAIQQAQYDYILSLDADEALSTKLVMSILAFKNKPDADAYEFNRLTNYCGKWIYYTDWYPDRKIRLFHRDKGFWAGENLHERLELKSGAVLKRIKGDILHYSYHSIAQHIAQFNHFTELGAKEAFDRGKRSNLLKILFSPVWKFFQSYFLRLGFLDGYYGFLVCWISAFATFTKYIKIKELQKESLVEKSSIEVVKERLISQV
jgi:glycosyltransferase involved in cell wall biosynthesis